MTSSGISSAQDSSRSRGQAVLTADTFHAFNATEKPLSVEALSYWTSFGRTYNPSTDKASTSPTWPQYGNSNQRLVPMEGGANATNTSAETIPNQYIQRCLVSRPSSNLASLKPVLDERHERDTYIINQNADPKIHRYALSRRTPAASAAR